MQAVAHCSSSVLKCKSTGIHTAGTSLLCLRGEALADDWVEAGYPRVLQAMIVLTCFFGDVSMLSHSMAAYLLPNLDIVSTQVVSRSLSQPW